MEIQGYFHNGTIVPHDDLALPEGTEVTITVRNQGMANSSRMSDEQRAKYLMALARLDSMENENPGDQFSGADHDRELYGDGS